MITQTGHHLTMQKAAQSLVITAFINQKFFLRLHVNLHSYRHSIPSGPCVGQRGGDDKTINAQHSQRALALVRELSCSPSSIILITMENGKSLVLVS